MPEVSPVFKLTPLPDVPLSLSEPLVWSRDPWIQRQLDLRDGQLPFPTRPTHQCELEWKTIGCPHECQEPRRVPCGCHERDCVDPNCREHAKVERAKGAYEHVGRCGDTAVIFPTLTLPLQAQRDALDRVVWKRLSHAGRRIIIEWVEDWCFGRRDLMLGGYDMHHPCGDNEDEWFPHFNWAIALRAWCKETESWVDGKCYLPKPAMVDLMDRWRDELLCQGYKMDCQPQVSYKYVPKAKHDALRLKRAKEIGPKAVEKYRTAEAGRHFEFRYFARGFPGWQGWTHDLRAVWGWCGSAVVGKARPPRGEAPWAWGKGDDPWHCPTCGTRCIDWTERAKAVELAESNRRQMQEHLAECLGEHLDTGGDTS